MPNCFYRHDHTKLNINRQKGFVSRQSIFASFGLPELNRTALANAATVSENLHDIFAFKFFEISCNSRKLSAKVQIL